MTAHTKTKVEQLRQENAIKTMYYTRYVGVRYAVAFYAFTNIYWSLLLYLTEAYWLLPFTLGLVALAGVGFWEQIKMFTREQETAKWTKRFFTVSLSVNLILSVFTLTPLFNHFYPFFADSWQARLLVAGLLLLGAGLAYLLLGKMKQIDANRDPQYTRIKHYLASIKV